MQCTGGLTMDLHERLREFNKWRRGETDDPQPCPKEIGELLDSAADRLEVLERESQHHFEQWHREKRLRQALEMTLEDIKDGLA
jgi:hypothetical protein